MGLIDRLRGGQPRVAFLGIDGVPYSLVRDNPDRFPNLTSLAEDGSAGPIESIVPPESSACWPSLTTGVNPGETGVYGFTDREVGSYDTYVPMGRDVRADRIWDRVHDEGRQATVFNVPVSFPPQRNVQRMASGFLSPGGIEKYATPDELRSTLDAVGYEKDVDPSLGHEADKSEFVTAAHDVLEGRYRAFDHYVEADDWDLFFGVFMTPDRVNHFLFEDYERDGEDREAFLDFYETLDEYIGNLRADLADDVTLIVAADHGFTTLDHEVWLNTWLEQEGWLSYADDDHEDLADIADETRAYSFIPGRFYINLEGREPRGSVPESEYDETRAELKQMLLDLAGPDGEPVCDRVVEREAAFDGAHDDIAPDLVAIPNDGFDLKAGFGDQDDVFDKGSRVGMHRFDGAAMFVDDPDVTLDGEVNLFDIAPTILDLMDVEYEAADFDGRSLV
ncbi:MAG: alkaline phosphatase family protein [Halobacteriaceae archaeon]